MTTLAHSVERDAASRGVARRIVNVIGCTLAALILLPIVWIALDLFVLDGRDGRNFEHIGMNATRRDVESVMGRPDDWDVCGNFSRPNDGRCATQVRYEHFLSTWVVAYSADGHVVDKFHLASE